MGKRDRLLSKWVIIIDLANIKRLTKDNYVVRKSNDKEVTWSDFWLIDMINECNKNDCHTN